MPTDLEAAIVAVTVYPGQARITRRGLARLPAGEHQVVLGDLPLGLHPDSVRVNARTQQAQVTVLGVDVRTQRHPRSPAVPVHELEQRQQALQSELDRLTDDDAVAQARAELLGSLARRSGTAFAKALAAGTAAPTAVAEVGDALAGQLAEVLRHRRELAERRRDVAEQHAEVSRRLGDRTAQRAADRRAIAVELDVSGDPDAAADVEFDMSYVLDDARWESRYDLRLHADTLVLSWYGMITQHTGEDWPECDLRLSTARPAGQVTVPELEPWFLDRELPSPGGAFGAAAENLDAAPPAGAMPVTRSPRGFARAQAAAEASVATATVEHGATAATYRPARPVAVPSDGTAHRTTVGVVELSAKLDHVTVPLRAPEAYLRATVVNTSEHTLPPGRASIFHDAEFVGATKLKPWAPGEERELTLGVDDRVRVERELVRRSAGKAVLGGTRRQEAEYQITVGNHGQRAANVTVLDQVPVSRDESIVVRDVQCDPKPVEQSELGELTWRLELASNQTAKITMGFRVDIAKGVRMSGWRD